VPGTPFSRAPAGRAPHEAQENPPDPHEAALGAPHGIEEPDGAALAKVENCFATFAPPHAGQVTPLESAPTRCSNSNRRPQSPQVYS
jgi:hypothetical protein